MATPSHGAPPQPIVFGGLGKPAQGNDVPEMGFSFNKPPPPPPLPPPDDGHKNSAWGKGFYGDIKGIAFSEKSIRKAFIRKVYGILSVQLLLTTSLIAILTFNERAQAYVTRSPGLSLASYITALIFLMVMSCFEEARRKSPYNVILLGLFTLTYGFVVGVIASQYDLTAVALAGIITTVIVIGLTVFSFQTKFDFTGMGGVLFCCVLVMFIFGIIMVVLPQITVARKLLACFGALLFSVYLIFDTQLMMGGTHKFTISPEEYIFAALNIYMDIIMIFLYVLRLFGRRR